MDIKEENIRLDYIDVLRGVAIIAVVFLHASSDYVWGFTGKTAIDWLVVNSFYSLSVLGVPIFFMISGTLLLKKNGGGDSLSRQILKVFVPFLCWSLFYCCYANDFDLSRLKAEMLFSPAYYHLWFMYVILGIYLSLPLIRLIVEKMRYRYFLTIWAGAFLVIPMMYKVLNVEMPTSWMLRENILFFLPYFILWFSGYFLIGRYIDESVISSKQKVILCILAIVSYLMTVFGSYYLTSMSEGVLDMYLYSEASITVLFMSVAVFIIIKGIEWRKVFKGRFLCFFRGIGVLAYGIYLIHPLVLEELRKRDLFDGAYFEWIYLTVSCLVISFVLVWLISRIWLLRNMLISFELRKIWDLSREGIRGLKRVWKKA